MAKVAPLPNPFIEPSEQLPPITLTQALDELRLTMAGVMKLVQGHSGLRNNAHEDHAELARLELLFSEMQVALART
jgi:hypothetical protein